MRFKGHIDTTVLFLTVILSLFTPLVLTEDINTLPFLTESYHEVKNIAFVGAIGGASHFNWVLTILDELSERNHNVTFFTNDGGVKFGNMFPNINTVSYGPDPVDDKEGDVLLDNLENTKDFLGLMRGVLAVFAAPWEKDFTALVDLFNRSNIDVVLCDHLVDACVDAAKATNKTFIITLVAETTKDSSAPYINMNLLSMTDFTTEFETVYERFMNAFVLPVKIILNFAGFFYEMGQRKNALGVTSSPDPSVEWKDNIKLVNSLFGITPARPVGPLVEHVGPILPRKYIPLDHDLQQFMDDHTRVGYVALGQHSKPNTNSLEMLLTSVLQTYESGELDGIIWSTVNTKHRFPESVTTSSNKTYIVSDIFEHKYPDFYFSKWASQTAILMHPSTHLFISHGGLGSWYESMYAGVREVVYPFFGDQLGNGLIIERGDMGAVLDSSMSIPQVTRILKDVAADVDNRIQSGVKRMQALVQIHSRNGAKLGADIVEEVAFTNINGKLPHRYEASRKMSFIKAHNIDIIGIFVAITLSVIFSSSFILVKIYKFISYQLKSGKKMKTQ